MLIEPDVASLCSELAAVAVAQRSVAGSSGAPVRKQCELTAPFSGKSHVGETVERSRQGMCLWCLLKSCLFALVSVSGHRAGSRQRTAVLKAWVLRCAREDRLWLRRTATAALRQNWAPSITHPPTAPAKQLLCAPAWEHRGVPAGLWMQRRINFSLLLRRGKGRRKVSGCLGGSL